MIPNISPSAFRTDDRGQLILLSAVAIVLIILGMVTLLNTAAFSQLERADGVDEYEGQTMQQLTDFEYNLETAMRHTNHDTSMANNTERRDRLDDEIAMIEDRMSERLAHETGQVTVNESSITYTEGIRIWQPGYQNLTTTETDEGPTPPGDPPAQLPQTEYGVITNADGVRSFTIAVTGENVIDPNSQSVTDNAFAVEYGIEGDSDIYTVYVYQDPDNASQIIIENGNQTAQCSAPASPSNPARISFTHGLLNDAACPQVLPGTENITGVSFNNGDNVEAAVDMVAIVDPSNVGFVQDNSNKEVRDSPTEDPDELQAHYAIYSTTLDVSVHSPRADYTATIRVAPQLPGESVDGGA